jgi:hypothetical protein
VLTIAIDAGVYGLEHQIPGVETQRGAASNASGIVEEYLLAAAAVE